MLKVKSLTYKYHNNQKGFTLNNCSLSVKKQEIVGIIGESGSGKTTLLKCIYGTFKPLSGSIIIKNKPINYQFEKLIKGNEGVRLVDQNFDLFEKITVKDNLIHHLNYLTVKEKNNIAKKLLADFHLTKLKNKIVDNLSGGEKQRVAIAKAIAENPSILLMDEPFSHIDNFLKYDFIHHIKKWLSATKSSVLLVTHDVETALMLCNRIYVMKKGKIIQKNTAENIYRTPKNEYAAHLLGRYSVVRLSGENTILRPDNFQITDVKSADLTVKVANVFYIGKGYEVIGENANNLITFYSENKICEGKIIGLNIII